MEVFEQGVGENLERQCGNVWRLSLRGPDGLFRLGFPLAKCLQQFLYQESGTLLFLIPLAVAGNQLSPYSGSICHNEKCLDSQW